MNSVGKITMVVTMLIMTLGLPLAQADAPTPRIDQRQADQEQRIEQGIASGELTNREATRLQHQQANIERLEQAAKTDGVVTGAEHARLTHKQNQASRAIARKKHNLRER